MQSTDYKKSSRYLMFLFVICAAFSFAAVSGSGSQSYAFRSLNKRSKESANFKSIDVVKEAKIIENEPDIVEEDSNVDISAQSDGGSNFFAKVFSLIPIATAAYIQYKNVHAQQEEESPKSDKKVTLKLKLKPVDKNTEPVKQVKEVPLPVENPKPVEKKRWVSKTFVDKGFLAMALLGTLVECIFSFMLLEIMMIATERMPHHMSDHINLAGWALLVFGISELLSNLPGFLFSKGKTFVSGKMMHDYYYNHLQKPSWSLRLDVSRFCEFLTKVSQTLALFLIWNMVKRDYEHAAIELYIWSRALDHLWRKAFYRERLPGFSLVVSVLTAFFGGLTAYEIWYLENPHALALYLPVMVFYLFKVIWSISIWQLNGKPTFLPMKTVQVIQTYYEKE